MIYSGLNRSLLPKSKYKVYIHVRIVSFWRRQLHPVLKRYLYQIAFELAILFFGTCSALLASNIKIKMIAIYGVISFFSFEYAVIYLRSRQKATAIANIDLSAIKLAEEKSPGMLARGSPSPTRFKHLKRYELLVEKLRMTEGKRLLDVGCADGIVTLEAAKKKMYAFGIDISWNYIAAGKGVAKKANLSSNIEFIVSIVEKPPFIDEAFDVLICSEVLEHLLNPNIALNEMSRVLKPGGRIILTTTNASSCPRSVNPILWMERLLSVFSDSFFVTRESAIDARFCQDVKYVPHRDFTEKEIIKMFNKYSFKILYSFSFGFHVLLYLPYILVVLKLVTKEKFKKYAESIESILSTLPILKFMGEHLFIEAQKH